MVHQYKLGGYNIVLDVNSGSVHSVDEVAYDVIERYGSRDKERIIAEVFEKYADRGVTTDDVAECYDEVDELREQGLLFAPDTFEPMAGKLKERSRGIVKALCLHVAHTCNLNCEYCFAGQGKFHGERARMSFET
ncbi:MAG: PqqD family peptide modification chaperone, partial [Clostridia bacterium]|nr:PqqD family peptide modification chaperone [Clostridia bacterium]